MAIFVTCIVAAILVLKFLLFLFRHFTNGKSSANTSDKWKESGSFSEIPEPAMTSMDTMDSLNPLSTTHPLSPLNPVNIVIPTDSLDPLEPINTSNPLNSMSPLNPMNPVGYSATMDQMSNDSASFVSDNTTNDENSSFNHFG